MGLSSATKRSFALIKGQKGGRGDASDGGVIKNNILGVELYYL